MFLFVPFLLLTYHHGLRKSGCPSLGTFEVGKYAQAIGYSYHLKEQLQALNPTCGGRAEGQDVQETQLQNRLPGSG